MKKNTVRTIAEKNSSVMEMSYETLCEEWLSINQTRHKESTRANYRMKFNKHIFAAFGHKKCSEINFQNIYGFISDKVGAGLSLNYIIDMLVLMKSVFNYAEKCYCNENPFDKVIMPKKKIKDKELLSAADRIRLENYLFENISIKNIGMLLALKMSMRIGEVCALKWSDVDLENKLLYVRHTVQRIKSGNGKGKTKVVIGDPKSVKSVRAIPIPPKMLTALKKLRGGDDIFIVSGKKAFIEPRTMQYRFDKVLKEIGIKKINFHMLRHIFATCAVERGFDIKTLSEIMGHSSVSITLKRYVHPDMELKRTYMELMDAA